MYIMLKNYSDILEVKDICEILHISLKSAYRLIHNIKDVQEWVGHKDIQTILNIYARTNEKRKTKVGQKMIETMFKDV